MASVNSSKSLNRIWLAVFVYFFFTCLLVTGTPAFAGFQTHAPHCDAVARPELAPSQDAIHDYRATQLGPVGNPSTTVNGIEYKIIGRLGRSSAIVNLAEAPNGRRVAIKTYTTNLRLTNDDMALVYYELVATDFLRTKKVRVPKIIDVEISNNKAVVVKEYVEGLTAEEVVWNTMKLPKDTLHYLRSRLDVARTELEAVFANHEAPVNLELIDWLAANEKNVFAKWSSLQTLPEATLAKAKDTDIWRRLLLEGDFESDGNLLWSTQEGRWILFDP